MCLVVTQALDTFTATFSTDKLYEKRERTKSFSYEATPTYPLGELEANKTLKFVIDIPYSE